MNSFVRALLFIYSVVIAVLSVVLLYATVDEGIFSDILKNLNALTTGPVSKYIYIGVLLLLFIISQREDLPVPDSERMISELLISDLMPSRVLHLMPQNLHRLVSRVPDAM